MGKFLGWLRLFYLEHQNFKKQTEEPWMCDTQSRRVCVCVYIYNSLVCVSVYLFVCDLLQRVQAQKISHFSAPEFWYIWGALLILLTSNIDRLTSSVTAKITTEHKQPQKWTLIWLQTQCNIVLSMLHKEWQSHFNFRYFTHSFSSLRVPFPSTRACVCDCCVKSNQFFSPSVLAAASAPSFSQLPVLPHKPQCANFTSLWSHCACSYLLLDRFFFALGIILFLSVCYLICNRVDQNSGWFSWDWGEDEESCANGAASYWDRISSSYFFCFAPTSGSCQWYL